MTHVMEPTPLINYLTPLNLLKNKFQNLSMASNISNQNENDNNSSVSEKESNLTSNFKEARELCSECKTPHGRLKTVEMNVPGEGKFLLLATSCDNCSYKNSQMLPMSQLEIIPISIKGVINTKDDLTRYVYLSAGTSVSFFIGALTYEFSCMNDLVGTVETLLYNAVNDISNAHEFATYTTNTGDEKVNVTDMHEKSSESIYNRSGSKLQLIASSEDVSDREKVRTLLESLKANMLQPDLILEVFDEKGSSRICPRNKFMSECSYNDLATYNDEHILHEFSDKE